MSRSTEEQDSAKSRGWPEGLSKRWSAQRKAEVVLRLTARRGYRRGEPGSSDRAQEIGPVAHCDSLADRGKQSYSLDGYRLRWPAGSVC